MRRPYPKYGIPFGLRKNGIPLDQLQKVKGKWQSNSQTYSDLEIAHFWNLKPSQFWESSQEDKIYMTAFTQTHYEIKAVEDRETEENIKRSQRKKNGR